MDNLREVAEKLETALKNEDEKTIAELISHKKIKDRQEIRANYSSLFHVDILTDIEKYLSWNFKKAVLAMFETPIDYDCKQIRQAVKSFITNDDTLIEILCTRPQEVIKQIKARYPELFPGCSLEKDIQNNTSGDYRKLLLSLIKADRAIKPRPDIEECEELAKALFEKGENMIGTDEDLFIEIFTKRSKEELKEILRAYTKIAGHIILEGIEKEFSGNIKDCLCAIIYGFFCPSEFYAAKLRQSIEGLGTDNNLLIRVLVTRKEQNFQELKYFYKTKYKIDIISDIKDDTRGNFKKLLTEFADY